MRNEFSAFDSPDAAPFPRDYHCSLRRSRITPRRVAQHKYELINIILPFSIAANSSDDPVSPASTSFIYPSAVTSFYKALYLGPLEESKYYIHDLSVY